MSALFFLIGCSVFMALVFLGAFIWANKTGQNEDTHTPGMRILFDDPPAGAADSESDPTASGKDAGGSGDQQVAETADRSGY